MTTQQTPAIASTQPPTLQAQDVVAGLGSAPRELLSTCLALFEDSTLQQRLSERIDALTKAKEKPPIGGAGSQTVLSSLQQRILHWREAPEEDEVLRLVLWMRLREALDLPPLSFGTLRSARTAADDVVAAMLRSIQPGSLEAAKRWTGIGEQRAIPDSLDALARQTLAELVANVMEANDAANTAARETLLREMKQRVAQLDDASRDRLLTAINAREFNDDAIRKMLLTGGGLATFGGAVSAAGFSAYILAAQASAFIPLISGPALVSFVAVLSNPITIVLATAGMGWWATRSANKKIQSAIAMRVISLLSLSGISAGDTGLRGMAQAFSRLPTMTSAGTLERKVLTKYQTDWALIAPAHRKAPALDQRTAQAMQRPLPGGLAPDRWEQLLRKGANGAAQDMAVMTVLTLGELVYHIHLLNPAVLAGADFSRTADLDDPVAFATFAHTIEMMGGKSHLGAISNLKGYVAEQVVAGQLVQQGHVVEFPETSNQAGWDIAVDGVHFQVKNAADLGLLAEHFEKGYDFPILANAEVADLLARAAEKGLAPEWANQVHFVEGYSQEAVQDVTDQTLDAGDSMLHPHVPAFVVTLSAIRQWSRYSSGQVSGSQAVQELILKGMVGAGLAVVGNYAGVAIGLLVFGPAGALVLGSALPIISRSQVGRATKLVELATKGEAYKRWSQEVHESLHRLIAVLEAGLTFKAERFKARVSQFDSVFLGDYLGWRVGEDVRFLREAWLRLNGIRDDKQGSVEDVGERLLVWLSTCTLHPATYQVELRDWLEVLGRRPSLLQDLSESKKGLTEFIGGIQRGLKEKWSVPISNKKD